MSRESPLLNASIPSIKQLLTKWALKSLLETQTFTSKDFLEEFRFKARLRVGASVKVKVGHWINQFTFREKEEKWILPRKQNSILRKPDQITDTSISALTFAMLLVRKTSESIPKKVEKVSKAPSVTSSANLHTICLQMLSCVYISMNNIYGKRMSHWQTWPF